MPFTRKQVASACVIRRPTGKQSELAGAWSHSHALSVVSEQPKENTTTTTTTTTATTTTTTATTITTAAAAATTTEEGERRRLLARHACKESCRQYRQDADAEPPHLLSRHAHAPLPRRQLGLATLEGLACVACHVARAGVGMPCVCVC